MEKSKLLSKLIQIVILLSLLGGCAVVMDEESTVGSPTGGKCSMCTVYIKTQNDNGGVVSTDSKWDVGVARARKLAERNCEIRGLGSLTNFYLRDGDWDWNYVYKCSVSTPVPQSQFNANQNLPQPPRSQTNEKDIDSAKKKCEQLGLKPATERFGQCVLQLTR